MTESGYLLDRLAIRDLQVEYTRALDANEFDRLERVFTPDGRFDVEGRGVFEGVEAIEGVASRSLVPLTTSQHFVGNHWAEVDGDTARAGCYFQAQHHLEGADGGANFIVAGTYTDELVRTDAGWRIRHRTLRRSWTEGNASVLPPLRDGSDRS